MLLEMFHGIGIGTGLGLIEIAYRVTQQGVKYNNKSTSSFNPFLLAKLILLRQKPLGEEKISPLAPLQ